MYHVGKKNHKWMLFTEQKRVKEEMKWIVPIVLETKGTFIFISANMRDTGEYLAIPIPSTLVFK